MFWVGKEVEGRFKGLQTLFIVGDQSVSLILDKIRDCSEKKIIIGHLYFGAGHQSTITNYNTIRYFISAGYLITLEVYLDVLLGVPEDIRMSCHIMACIRQDNVILLKTTDTIKLETLHNVYCITKEQMIKTFRSEYKDDQNL